MKALLINPRGELGLMTWRKTCQMTGCKAVHPPIGLLTVAALLPQDWQLRLIDQEVGPVREEDWNWADIVLLSGMIEQTVHLLELIREAKARGKRVVVGGPYATIQPDDCLTAGCDLLLRGEAENAMDKLLAALNEDMGERVIDNRERPDLSLSPIPRFDLLDLRQYIVMGVQTSRGCPYACEFCSVADLVGRKPRYKNPGQVIKELETLFDLGWRGEIFITDDNFIGNKRQARAILEKLNPWLRDHDEPFDFHAHVSVDLGSDEDMMDRLTDANFTTVYVGIESTDPEVLERTNKHQNIRHPPLEGVRKIRDNGLNVVGHFIMGFDGEEPGEGDRIIQFIEACRMPMALVHILKALPGTRLWKRLEQEGRLLPDRSVMDSLPARPNFVPTRPELEIMEEYHGIWDTVFNRSHYLSRTYHYFTAMRPRRRTLRLRRGGSLKGVHRNLRAFLRLVWWQGVRSSSRRQFWWQIKGMRAANPSQLPAYIGTCGVGENMFELRELVLQNGDNGARPAYRKYRS